MPRGQKKHLHPYAQPALLVPPLSFFDTLGQSNRTAAIFGARARNEDCAAPSPRADAGLPKRGHEKETAPALRFAGAVRLLLRRMLPVRKSIGGPSSGAVSTELKQLHRTPDPMCTTRRSNSTFRRRPRGLQRGTCVRAKRFGAHRCLRGRRTRYPLSVAASDAMACGSAGSPVED